MIKDSIHQDNMIVSKIFMFYNFEVDKTKSVLKFLE